VARTALAAAVVAVFAGVLAWAASSYFKAKPVPIGLPAGTLQVSNVHWAGDRGSGSWKVFETVRNRGSKAVGATTSCVLVATDGSRKTSYDADVNAIDPGHSVGLIASVVGFHHQPARGSCTAQATPAVAVTRTPNPGGLKSFQPQSVAFWDPQRGLAAGYAGHCSPPCGPGLIAATTDGGQTWSEVNRSTAPVLEVSVVDPNRGWALAGTCSNPGPANCDNTILETSDGGQTWAAVGRAPVNHIDFVDSTNGWGLSLTARLSGTTGEPIAKTSDGGATWTTVPGPCPADASMPSGIHFVDALHGWMSCVGDAATVQQGKAVFETTDGGTTWKGRAHVLTAAQTAGDLSINGHTPQLFFLPDGRGWLWMDRDCLYSSADRGQTWTRTASDICSPDLNFVKSAEFFSDQNGVALLWVADAQQLRLIVSHDGGASWSNVHAWPTA